MMICGHLTSRKKNQWKWTNLPGPNVFKNIKYCLHIILFLNTKNDLFSLTRNKISCLNYIPSNLWYKRHQIQNLKCFSSRLAVDFAQSTEARFQVENEDVVGAVPTGDAPTTNEWSTHLLPTKVLLILDFTVVRIMSVEDPVTKWVTVWADLILNSVAQNNTGGRLNKKDGLTRYGNSHVKDKTS